MQAIILAAGMGKRLKDLTANNTKCMVKVNGVTLIERMLNQLDKIEINRIIIVVGYEGHKLIDYISTLNIKKPIEYVENPIYDKTNNIYSLALAKQYLIEDDTILLESDLIFEDSVLTLLLEDTRETLALVDKYESWMDGTVIKIGSNDEIQEFIPGKKFIFADIPQYYKTVNIYKFSRHFSETHYVPFLEAYSKALGNNEYYEQVLRVITMLDNPEIKAKKLDGQLWYEIDDIQDLDIAESMFHPDNNEKVKLIQSRYGGYWRYPKILDFCYLVNPYFPPQRLSDEIKANFEQLLTQYPSGLRVNNLIAAKNFGVNPSHLVVGNGAAELINALMTILSGKNGFIRPTFEEYPNRSCQQEDIVFTPTNDRFQYNVKDIIKFFNQKEIQNLILINPDNPSGNFIEKEEVTQLLEWSSQKKIRIIFDESFIDFAENSYTLIDEQIIRQYPHLVVVKSISKSYGVPGLRLGILVTADEKLMAKIQKAVSIWNINSFGEFYLQIAEKYKAEYLNSLDKIKETRREFSKSLEKIGYLRIIPSQANYIMAEIKENTISASELSKILLLKYNILIKDLSGKIKTGQQMIRIAVRNDADNNRLVQALQDIDIKRFRKKIK